MASPSGRHAGATIATMRLATLIRGRHKPTLPGVTGAARLDRRTAALVDRLHAGDIAVIDHVDLDRSSAEALIGARVAAVVNAAPSISGRYPNLGPELLVAAGVPLLDGVGPQIFAAVRDGTTLRLDEDRLYLGEVEVAAGTRLDEASVAEAMEAAKAGLASQLEAFAADTHEFLRREQALLLDGEGLPELTTDLTGRHALVVVDGFDARADLTALRPYIREYHPKLVGVDGGADLLLAAGYRPDLIIGDLGQLSDPTLRCGAEIVAQLPPGGVDPTVLQRVQDLGIQARTVTSSGSSEDVALLITAAGGAALIVGVGTHATLTEFLDRGRGVMAGTFLTRLRLGGVFVDAKAVRQLFRSRVSGGALLLLVLAALVAVGVALAVSAVGDPLATRVGGAGGQLLRWIAGVIR